MGELSDAAFLRVAAFLGIAPDALAGWRLSLAALRFLDRFVAPFEQPA